MKQSAVNYISREHTNSAQMTTLLNAFQATTAFLLHARDLESELDGTKMDGGAKAAAETAVIGICQRLEAMMADADRWTLNRQSELETSLVEAYKATAETAVAGVWLIIYSY